MLHKRNTCNANVNVFQGKRSDKYFRDPVYVEKRGRYLGGLVVTNDDSGVPLRSALGPINLDPEAN